MKILVTGGSGFVGFNLARGLAEAGHSVTAMDNLARRGSELNVPKFRQMGVPFIHGDIRRPEDFAGAPKDLDCVLECSAQPSVTSGYSNPMYDFTTNVQGLMNCLEFCRSVGAGMIFLSSSRVYPAPRVNALPMVEKETRWDWDEKPPASGFPKGFDPVRGIGADFSMDGPGKTIYGASKAAADFFCREYADAYNMPVVVNRCGVIAGEGQFGVVNQGWLTFWAMSCLFERPIVYLGHRGKQVRDILFIDDLMRLIHLQLGRLNEIGGRVWNVGGGRDRSLSLVEAAALMEKFTGKRMLTSLVDVPRKGDVIIYITDNTQVMEDFRWRPKVSLTEGAERIVRWVKDNRAALEDAGL
jgi:CDP-paratose 2-epimerase